MTKPRNLVACSPIMRKGEPHTQSKTGQRFQSRQTLNELVDDWYDGHEHENNHEHKAEKNGSQKAPVLRYSVLSFTRFIYS